MENETPKPVTPAPRADRPPRTDRPERSNDRGKIKPRRKIGTCARHQRRLTLAIKRARVLALLTYAPPHIHGM